MIEDLALIAHPDPSRGEVEPPEAFHEVRVQSAEQRRAYAENLRTMLDSTGEDPLLAALRSAAARRDAAETQVRALLAYGRQFTGTRPDYTWQVLGEAAGLPYSTARRTVGEQEIETVRTALEG